MALISRNFLKSVQFLTSRGFHASSEMRSSGYKKFMFNISGYNKYGLLHDDLLLEVDDVVAEAVRRLPEEEQMSRISRSIRAHHLETNHDILPRDQWTKFEDNHYYLRPYIAEVLKEREEMSEWEANH